MYFFFFNSFGILLEFLRDVWLGGSDFFENSLGILWEHFGNFFENSLGILWEHFGNFFGNSLGILSEFFGDVWFGGYECVGVDFGNNSLRPIYWSA